MNFDLNNLLKGQCTMVYIAVLAIVDAIIWAALTLNQ